MCFGVASKAHVFLLIITIININLYVKLACLMWLIWRERNTRTFEDVEKSIDLLKSLLVGTLFGWSCIWSFTFPYLISCNLCFFFLMELISCNLFLFPCVFFFFFFFVFQVQSGHHREHDVLFY